VTDDKLKLPSYAKATIFLVGLFALLSMLYIAKSIIVPLVFATIFAIVLHPVVNFFVRIKINRVVAIVITLLLTFIVIAAFGLLFISQASRFTESLPLLAEKFTAIFNQTITWAAGYFDINAQKIHEWFTNIKDAFINTSSASLGKTLVSVGNLVVILFLLPVYIFMLLFYHPILLEFIHRFFGVSNESQVSQIITQTKSVIQRYLIGLVIEAAIVATLNSIALLILGIEYAILLGIIGALLNIIPYIGGMIGVILFIVVTLVTKSSVYIIYVIIIYSLIQFVDNNYIVPKIVASKVKINALFAIVVVIAGSALWGIPGMFISIPILAIIKLICDHIDSLKHWGFLLGDTMPPLFKIKPIHLIKIKPIHLKRIKNKPG
jgi:predicted PurR-regulated permease PerM